MITIDTQRQDRDAIVRELEATGAKFCTSGILCPFHEDHRPSAGIYQGTDGAWRFKCQACGVCEDIFGVRAKVQGRPLAEILVEAGSAANQKVTSSSSRSAGATKMRRRDIGAIRAALPGHVTSEHVYTNPATGAAELIVFRVQTPEGKSYRPVRLADNGYVFGAPPKPWPLYRRDAIEASDTVVVCEGEKCCDALAAQGIAATTNPFGAGKAEHCDWSPLAGKRVILWADSDITGRNHMVQVTGLIERLTPVSEILILDPAKLDLAEKEDAADFITQCMATGDDPKRAVRDALTKAQRRGVAGLLEARLADTMAGRRRPVDFLWPKLSEMSRALVQNTVTLFCGSPGATKSFFLLECLTGWHERGIKVACYCLEEGLDYHLNRVLAQREGNGDLTREEWIESHPEETQAAYERHEAFLSEFGRRLWAAPEQAPTKADLAQWARDRAEEGCRVIVIDPLSAARETRDVWVSDSEFVNAIKATVRDYPVSVLVVMHPRKGHGPGPGTLDDLAGGACYQRLAQTVLWLQFHRPPLTQSVSQAIGRGTIEFNRTMHILKARNGVGDHLGLAFGFNPKTLRTTEHGVILGND
jgi:AAA domain